MLKRFSSCDADGASLFKRASDHETDEFTTLNFRAILLPKQTLTVDSV